MLPSWANQTITVIRPGVKVERGSQMRDRDNVLEFDVSGCSIQPASTSLSQDGRVLGIEDGMTGFLPLNTDIREGDRVSFDGQTYELNGAPRVWHSATGRASYVQIGLRRWSG